MSKAMDEAIDELCGLFPGLEVDSAGGTCPFQAYGTLHGQLFYLRFRHNWGTLSIGGDQHFKALYNAAIEFGDGPDQGWLEPDEFVSLASALIRRLERAQIYWEFPGVAPEGFDRVLPSGGYEEYGAWGHTPEQAWERLHEPSELLRAAGWSDERQRQYRAACKINPQTVTVDDRVFPDPDPFVAVGR